MTRSLQTPEGDFVPPLYGQMCFLNPDESVEERLAHPINYWNSGNLMDLLEEIL